MMPFFLSTFLLFDTEYSLGSSSIFHSPVLESVTALGIPDSFHWRMVFRNQYEGAKCTHCYFRALLLLGLLRWKELGNISVIDRGRKLGGRNDSRSSTKEFWGNGTILYQDCAFVKMHRTTH